MHWLGSSLFYLNQTVKTPNLRDNKYKYYRFTQGISSACKLAIQNVGLIKIHGSYSKRILI